MTDPVPAPPGTDDLGVRVWRAAHLTGEFRLRSGAVSDHYFDKYRVEADPGLLAEVAAALVPLVPEGTELLAGLELGGVPLATALSLYTGLPARFVRKRAKEYGTCQLAEGGEVAGRRVLVVEDVVTSAGQVVASTARLREAGARVAVAVCMIDRQAGGAAALAAAGVQLRPLFTRAQLEAAGSSR